MARDEPYHVEWQRDGGRQKIATSNAIELYNIEADSGERKNLVNEHTAKRDELLDDLLKWVKSLDAPLPAQKHLFAGDAPTKWNIGIARCPLFE